MTFLSVSLAFDRSGFKTLFQSQFFNFLHLSYFVHELLFFKLLRFNLQSLFQASIEVLSLFAPLRQIQSRFVRNCQLFAWLMLSLNFFVKTSFDRRCNELRKLLSYWGFGLASLLSVQIELFKRGELFGCDKVGDTCFKEAGDRPRFELI